MDKEKVTMKEHIDLGNLCKMLNVKLINLAEEIRPKTKYNSSHPVKARKHLLELKHHMEEIMVKEYPDVFNDNSIDWIHVYYGDEQINTSEEHLKHYKPKRSLLSLFVNKFCEEDKSEYISLDDFYEKFNVFLNKKEFCLQNKQRLLKLLREKHLVRRYDNTNKILILGIKWNYNKKD